MWRYLVPLGVFGVLVVFLFKGLSLNPREVPSPLVNKPAPAFTLAELKQPTQEFSEKSMLGKVWLLNVWASWCVACREEHPLLVEISKQNVLPIVGLNYKDEPAAALRWLAQWGDPYTLAVKDRDGRVGIEYGVYGVPETFLIDKQGVIRFKQIGPVTPEAWEKKMLPLIRELEKA